MIPFSYPFSLLLAFPHRSLWAGSAQASLKLVNRRNGRSVTYLSFARSGSTIRNGLIGQTKGLDHWIGNIGQLKEAKLAVRDRTINALVISIGGNDIGFASRITDLVAGDSSAKRLFLGGGDDDENREAAEAQVNHIIDVNLKAEFESLRESIRNLDLDVKNIYLTEYPVGLFDRLNQNGERIDGAGCEIFSSTFFDVDISSGDAAAIRRIGMRLNTKLRSIVETFNEGPGPSWIYVDGIADAFAGRGYCGNGLLVRASESLSIQGDTKGTLHPNIEGHQIYAEKIYQKLLEHTIVSGRPPAPIGIFARFKAVLRGLTISGR